MGLSDDERKLLDELTARASEPDADDEFEIEIYSPDGKGARIPFRKGKNWLYDTFGIGDPPGAAGGDGSPGGDAPPAGGAGQEGPKTGKGIFGRQP